MIYQKKSKRINCNINKKFIIQQKKIKFSFLINCYIKKKYFFEFINIQK